MSVINQMLRDLQARGQTLPYDDLDKPVPAAQRSTRHAGPAVNNAAHPAARIPIIAGQSINTRKPDRIRVWAWTLTLLASAATVIALQWQKAELQSAAQRPRPLGYAQYAGALSAEPTNFTSPQDAQQLAIASPLPAAPIANAEPIESIPTNPTTDPAQVPAPPQAPSPTPHADQPAARAIQTAEVPGASATPAQPPPAAREAAKPKPAPKPSTPAPQSIDAGKDATPGIRLAQSNAQRLDQQLSQAGALIASGRNAEASNRLAQLLSAHPEHIDARQALAALQAEQGQTQQALITLLDGAVIHPTHFAPLAASVQVQLGDLQSALATLDRIPAAARHAHIHALTGGIAQRLGQHERAAAAYRQALDGDTHLPSASLGLGLSLEALGQHAQALEAYQQANAQASASIPLKQYAAERYRALAQRMKHENPQ